MSSQCSRHRRRATCVEVGAAIARDQARAPRRVAGLAEQEHDLDARARRELDRRSAARRRDRGRRRLGRDSGAPRRERRGPFERAVAAEELRPVAGPRRLPPREVGERDASRELGRATELRANIAPCPRSISVTTKGAAAAARGAEHPLDVGGDREPARAPRAILDRQARDLDRIVAAARTAAARARCRARRARSGCSPGRVARRRLPSPRGSAAPSAPTDRAAVFVAHVDRLARAGR